MSVYNWEPDLLLTMWDLNTWCLEVIIYLWTCRNSSMNIWQPFIEKNTPNSMDYIIPLHQSYLAEQYLVLGSSSACRYSPVCMGRHSDLLPLSCSKALLRFCPTNVKLLIQATVLVYKNLYKCFNPNSASAS